MTTILLRFEDEDGRAWSTAAIASHLYTDDGEQMSLEEGNLPGRALKLKEFRVVLREATDLHPAEDQTKKGPKHNAKSRTKKRPH